MSKKLGVFLEELKYKCDITDVIGKYITLTQKGRSYWGRCPFHHEKTPSFAVNAEDQYYHCFGCSASGDVIKFVQEIESIDFFEAVNLLSEKSGLKMPDDFARDDSSNAEAKKLRDRLYALMKDAAKYYHTTLNTKGERVYEYLYKRGFSKETIVKFGLGFSSDFNSIINYLSRKGYTESEMLSCGVASKKDKSAYDSLGTRLIVPIINSMGDVIAFGGRAMGETSFAKYKNTAETPLFNKSKNLYAINLVKKQKQEKGIDGIIVVEGYMDAMALHQAGFKNAVASMGTALTKEQARLIRRFTDEVIICYDGDSAGQNATIRGLDILRDEGLSVRVIDLPTGYDPDEYIIKHGNESFYDLIRNAPPLSDFKLMSLAKRHDLTSNADKRKYVQKALAVVAKEADHSVKEELLKLIRTQTEITYESLKREMENIKETTDSKPPAEVLPKAIGNDTNDIKALRFILYCALKNFDFAKDYQVVEQFINEDTHFKIYSYIKDCEKQGVPLRPSALFEIANEEEFKEVTAVLESGDMMDRQDQQAYYKDCIKLLLNEGYERKLKLLTSEFEQETDTQKRKQIALKIQVLTMEQKKNRN